MVTPKAAGKHELLFSNPAIGTIFKMKNIYDLIKTLCAKHFYPNQS
jgi:hypothetical protein